MGFSDSHHFRKTVAGCCMVVGPLLALVAFIVSPAIKSGSAAQVAEAARHQDRFLISGLLSLVAVVLVIAGALGLMHMLRERMVGYGNLGGTLALVGLVFTMAQVAAQLTLWAAVRDGVQAADASTWRAITHATAMVIPLIAIPWLAVIGLAVLAMGLYRAHAVDWWMAAMLALGALGITLAGPLASVAVGIVGAALFLVGMGSIGMLVLRESDADWEHTPDYHGFRPAAGMR
jgi:heme/copper-type cytochrome/quinol oxidase subunit 2